MSDKTGVEYAFKCIQKQELLKQPKGKDLLYREIRAMKCLRGHPNIVELKEIFQTSTNVYLVMEMVKVCPLFSTSPPMKLAFFHSRYFCVATVIKVHERLQ